MIDPREGYLLGDREIRAHAAFMLEMSGIVDEYEERMEKYREWT